MNEENDEFMDEAYDFSVLIMLGSASVMVAGAAVVVAGLGVAVAGGFLSLIRS
jgi:hypothetical protein